MYKKMWYYWERNEKKIEEKEYATQIKKKKVDRLGWNQIRKKKWDQGW